MTYFEKYLRILNNTQKCVDALRRAEASGTADIHHHRFIALNRQDAEQLKLAMEKNGGFEDYPSVPNT